MDPYNCRELSLPFMFEIMRCAKVSKKKDGRVTGSSSILEKCCPDSLCGGVFHEAALTTSCQIMMHWLKCQVLFRSYTIHTCLHGVA